MCVDGTFKVVPKPYYQLFTISFIKNTHVFPVVYCLLKNKLQTTYEDVFKIIFSLNGTLKPNIIKTDFEFASLNCLKNIFPLATVSGCQFHLGQNLQRKIKELNLFSHYKQNNNFRLSIKALLALSYVQPEKIVETFNVLPSLYFYDQLVNPVYLYFYNNYIKNFENARINYKIWNHYNLFSLNVPRTNNAIEGWHNAFNGSFFSSKYSFVNLISKLKEDEENIQQKIIRFENGEKFYKKKKYIILEEQITNLINNSQIHYGSDFVINLINVIYY